MISRLDVSADTYRLAAVDVRMVADTIRPDTPSRRYSIVAAEVLAVAFEHIAAGGCAPWEMWLAHRRQSRLAAFNEVTP